MNKNIIKLFAILVMCFMICAVLVACSSTQGAQGPKGDKGESIKGDKGDDGKDGTKVTIGADGYFYLDGVKTEWKAEGKDATECNLADHDWQIEDFRPHTQYATGLKIGICSDCGDAKWFVEDHEFTTEHLHAPNCTEDGYIEYSCACGKYSNDVTVVPATGHSYDAVVTAPTCVDKGYTTYTCACGYTYVDDYVDALGHDHAEFDEDNIDLDAWTLAEPKPVDEPCLKGDVYVNKCSRCDVKISAETTPIGHDLGDKKLAENQQDVCYCQDQLVYVSECQNEGCSYQKESFGDPIGHNHEGWKVTVTPTTTTAGEIKNACANADKCKADCTFCNKVETLPALDETNYTLVTVEATCSSTGSMTYTYNKYNTVKVVITLDKTAHDYENGAWKVVTKPTNTTTGTVEFKCNDCTETKLFTLPALTDAAYTVVAGSCATQKDTYEITLNGEKVTFTVEHEYAHSFPSEETLEAEGVYYIYTVRYCSECDAWVVIDARLK